MRGSRRSLVAGALLTVVTLAWLAGPAAPARGAFVSAGTSGCPRSTEGAGPGRIFRVRNMSCADALAVWERGRGWMHVSLTQGDHFKVGSYRCVTYLNLTPPGPSDADVHSRCSRGRHEFWLVYAI
jgi:hypothetical protein